MTWRQEAAKIIAEATRDLPEDATLAERKRVVDAACPPGWRTASWPQKAWQAARRDYLIRYGYQPRTKPKAPQDGGMPLFGD
ncbi:hypothetical protein [Tranquillimonas rosea]|uniref:hypothetical protein n=1 Tax=Tranquillimonas rosea TaxID=641238 RepID=UPI003BA9D9A4